MGHLVSEKRGRSMLRRPTTSQGGGKVSWFYRALYRSYSLGTIVSLFFNRRVTPVGWGILSLLLLTAILGVDFSKSTLYQLFALIVGALAVSLGWAWCRRGRLMVERELPRYATVGERLSYFVTVTNLGRYALRGFFLDEWPPDARPTMMNFARIGEPGEEQRNAFDRVFVYYRWRWLMERRLLFEAGRGGGQLMVGSGNSLKVRMEILPRKRGIIPLSDLRLRLPDPLGLFQRCRKVLSGDDCVTVFPRYYRLAPMKFSGQACFEHGGDALSHTAGQSGDFLGLRDYRSGDPMRRIHWKGWARTGRPIVREFEDISLPHYALILDNFVEHGDENLLEDSISVAASFARAIDARHNTVDLVTMRDQAIVVREGQGVGRSENIMKVLAEIAGDPEERLEDLEKVVIRHSERLTAGIAVFTGWNHARADFLGRLAMTGLEITALILCRDASAVRSIIAGRPLPCRHYLLEPPAIEEELLKIQI